jgi:cephalosporin hydroxylase
MTIADDRKEFEAHKRQMALALGADRETFRQCVSTVSALDKYDYAYLWSWMGVPIIQMPADILATQEVIWNTKPDIVIETGVARGGSVIFMASLLKLIGKGRVIGVDIDIRAHNRDSIERHALSPLISLVEGPSTATETLARVKAEIPAGASVMVVLDSDHSRDHVLDELRAYGPLVTRGQYLVVADTLLGQMDELQTPTKRSKVWYAGDEPYAALRTYMEETEEFESDDVLNGKLVLSSSPGGYIRRRAGGA